VNSWFHRGRDCAIRIGIGNAKGSRRHPSTAMLHYAIVFLIIAIIAAVLGFGTLSGIAATVAKVCFVIFLIVAILSFLKKKT
jgi:uncharacterized membrane protein YtjA (UPF0391 family)